MAKSKTASSTPRLSDVARHVHYPSTIVTTEWPRVVAKCAEVGVTFDGWQHGIGSIALGKRADGKYASTVGGVVLSIPRQVGKTFIVGMIVIALCLIHPGLTVLWSAHRTRTATKTFGSLKAMTSRKKIAPHVLDPRNVNGEQEIRFVNGSVIMFGAREGGFGRGFDEVDIEVFDEAQILTEKALEDMVAATNQTRQEAGALLFFMGTPPRPSDPGEEFSNRREKGLAGTADDMVYVEFSADAKTGTEGGPSLDDHTQWRKANPSFPDRTPLESMLRMRAQLTNEASFRREALGIWDEKATAALISGSLWKRSATSDPVTAEGRTVYGVKFSVDGASFALAACLRPDDGSAPHAELVMHQLMTVGTDALEDFLTDRWSSAAEIVIDGKSGAGALVVALRAAEVPARVLRLPTLDQVTTAHAMTLRHIREASMTHFDHPGQSALDLAVTHAMKRKIGQSGGFGWQSTTPEVDVTPFDAMTLALHGAMTTKRRPGQRQERI